MPDISPNRFHCRNQIVIWYLLVELFVDIAASSLDRVPRDVLQDCAIRLTACWLTPVSIEFVYQFDKFLWSDVH